jgi:polar amino acid transport system substrate-binding protein
MRAFRPAQEHASRLGVGHPDEADAGERVRLAALAPTCSSEGTMKHIREIAILFSLACVSSQANAACEPQRVAEKYPRFANKVVKVATPTTTPPFAYSNPANLEQMTGVEIEMMELTLKCAGLSYEYVKGPFSSLIQSVMSGATDVMIGNVNYRAERAEKVDFVVYMRSGQGVIVNKGNPKKLRAVEDLCGMTASSTVGGVSAAEVERQSAACVRRGRPAISYVPAADQEAAVRQLTNGRIDFVMDGSISARMRAQADNRDLEIGFTVLTDLVIGPAIKKDNDEIRRAVLEGMQELERDGRLKALLGKYELSEFAQPVELRR